MNEGLNLNDLRLYMLKNVRITLNGGDMIYGQMSAMQQETNSIQIENDIYPLSELKDVELVGMVKDYRTYHGFGEIEDFPFSLEDIADGLDPDIILYGEFDCVVACHLHLTETGIRAKDITYLSNTHRVDPAALERELYMYKFTDGTFRVGRYERSQDSVGLVLTDGSFLPVDMGNVVDITKAPAANDYIYLTLNDQSHVSGLVSGTTDTMVAIIGDNVSTINYADIQELRYRGTVLTKPIVIDRSPSRLIRVTTNVNKADSMFLCKKPYFQNPEQMEHVSDGDVVSFVAGVTERGLIAKSIKIEGEKAENDSYAPAEYTGKGILWFTSDYSGFIFKEFITDGYQKLHNLKEKPRGSVSFTRNQIDFDCEWEKIYVVSYTCVGNPEDSVQPALTVQLERTYPYTDYARVWINEEGEICALPSSVAFLHQFKGQNVELQLKNGSDLVGYVEDCSDGRYTLIPTDSSSSGREVIHEDEIAKVRFYGVISRYNKDRGTGHIGLYWFHINSLGDSNDVAQIEEGRRVTFTIEQTHKGNGYAATDILLIPEELKSGFLVGYDGANCKILTPEEYGNLEEPVTYPAIKEMRADITVKLSNLDLKSYDYPIKYLLWKNGLEKHVEITFVDSNNRKARYKYGYVLKYMGKSNGKGGYGFILPPEELEEHLKKNSNEGKIIFYEEEIVNVNQFKMNTFKYYYHVSFIQDDGNRARNVRILSEHSFPQNSAPAHMKKKDIPVCDGESVLFQMADSSVGYHIFHGSDEGFYIVDDQVKIPKDSVSEVLRFGVVTDFNMEAGSATINRSMDFTLDIAEIKLINILKSQQNVIRLHVVYAYEDGRITKALRIPDAYSRLIRWEEGTVTGCEASRRMIVVNGFIRHYMSVLSDGMISRSFKNNTLIDQSVFIKPVYHVFLEENSKEVSLMTSAIDVRCEKEVATIQYDIGRDIYLAYRNPTFFYPVYGTPALLDQYVGREAEIVFKTGSDQLVLEAGLEGDSFAGKTEDSSEEYEIESAALENVISEHLVRFCMGQVDLGQMIPEIVLNDEGMPKDLEQAQKAFKLLHGRPDDMSFLAEAQIAMKYPEIELENNGADENQAERNRRIGKRAINMFRKRCRILGLNPNVVFGEYTYYLSLLLRYSPEKNTADGRYNCLYRLLLQDFGNRENLSNHVQNNEIANRKRLKELLSGTCRRIDELVSHIIILDQKNLELICSILAENTILSNEIIQFASSIDEKIRGKNLSEALLTIRERYTRDRSRFSSMFGDILNGHKVYYHTNELIIYMQERFLKLVGNDDKDRFERLKQACYYICDYQNKAGFSEQEKSLKDAYRNIVELEKEIIQHPCRESVEIIMMCRDETAGDNILTKLKLEINDLLDNLYQRGDTKPQIICTPNEEMIEEGQDVFWLVIRNGSQYSNLQPADNITIKLESYTEGVSVNKEIGVDQIRLAAGEQTSMEIDIHVDSDINEKFYGDVKIGWSAEYEYSTSFENGATVKTRISQDQNNTFELQYGKTNSDPKNREAVNPYLVPSQGQPLVDKDMFYGRESERKEILDSIISQVDGNEEFIPGSAVIIHGQKKSGKTSLVYQIKNYIKENKTLGPKAIILNFKNILDEIGGVEALSSFKRIFYAQILFDFEDEINEEIHSDVADLLDEHGLEVPDLLTDDKDETWPVAFDRFFKEFFKIDQRRHTIILIMDEFTMLCTTILEVVQNDPSSKSLVNIPTFIKTFSQYGFVQVIIGHEAMMRAFDKLGVLNHTAEFAKSIEIAALDQEASKRLVREPMENAFGFDVYGTELGNQAVDKLLDLSGCNPTYLVRLCSQMFDYYVSGSCTRSQLLVSDVDTMVRNFINEILLSYFDILLVEDGDEVEDAEMRFTYQYLKCAAFLSADSLDGRTADINQIKDKLKDQLEDQLKDQAEKLETLRDDIEKTRNLLEARRVISITSGGRVKINTGLFREYILQKNGEKQ